jgi:hypothetical protein
MWIRKKTIDAKHSNRWRVAEADEGDKFISTKSVNSVLRAQEYKRVGSHERNRVQKTDIGVGYIANQVQLQQLIFVREWETVWSSIERAAIANEVITKAIKREKRSTLRAKPEEIRVN